MPLMEVGSGFRPWMSGPSFLRAVSHRHLLPHVDGSAALRSGGKVLKSRTMKNRHRAIQAFRMVAQSVLRSHCAFGACSRRIQGRLGPAQAVGATAHKSARTVSHILKNRVQYHDIGATEYHKRFRERERHY